VTRTHNLSYSRHDCDSNSQSIILETRLTWTHNLSYSRHNCDSNSQSTRNLSYSRHDWLELTIYHTRGTTATRSHNLSYSRHDWLELAVYHTWGTTVTQTRNLSYSRHNCYSSSQSIILEVRTLAIAPLILLSCLLVKWWFMVFKVFNATFNNISVILWWC
jgi:hypothetical protein